MRDGRRSLTWKWKEDKTEGTLLYNKELIKVYLLALVSDSTYIIDHSPLGLFRANEINN